MSSSTTSNAACSHETASTFDAILAEHAGLVWCTITGFGTESDRAGYDFVVQAEQGWMAITGEPDGAPMKVASRSPMSWLARTRASRFWLRSWRGNAPGAAGTSPFHSRRVRARRS